MFNWNGHGAPKRCLNGRNGGLQARPVKACLCLSLLEPYRPFLYAACVRVNVCRVFGGKFFTLYLGNSDTFC